VSVTEKQIIAYRALKLDQLVMQYEIDELSEIVGDFEPKSLDYHRLADMLANLRKAVLAYFDVHFMTIKEMDEFIRDAEEN